MRLGEGTWELTSASTAMVKAFDLRIFFVDLRTIARERAYFAAQSRVGFSPFRTMFQWLSRCEGLAVMEICLRRKECLSMMGAHVPGLFWRHLYFICSGK